MGRHMSKGALVFSVMLGLLCGLASSCSSNKGAVPATPTLDAQAVQEAAIATLVARMSAATPTSQDTPTSTAEDALKKLATMVPSDTAQPTQPPLPSRTPRPTSTPQISLSIDLTGMHYEAWGKPVNDACRQFDDSHPMRKFQLEISLYNGSRQKITEWYPEFYANSGRLVITCFYGHGNVKGFPEIPAGESRTVTFAAFAENNEYITQMKMVALGQEFRRCFNKSGALINCQ